MLLEDALDRLKAFQNTLVNDICSQLKLQIGDPLCDAANDAVSDVLIAQLYTTLFDLFRERTRDKDLKTNSRIAAIAPMVQPAMLGIKRQFWLIADSEAPQDIGEAATAAYQPAITALQAIPTAKTAAAKVRCLVEAMTAVPACVERFHTGQAATSAASTTIAVGAEELVPIFTFVLLKSRLRNPNAEAAFMSEFMSEQMCIDEEGYSLATFLTCVDFVDQLTCEDLEGKRP